MRALSPVIIGVLGITTVLNSQVTPARTPNLNADKYKIQIKRTTEPMNIDGFLSEKTWQTADLADNFWQQKPLDDKPASRRTIARIAYDDRNLYVAAICFDSNHYMIQTLKRDKYGDSDEFAILLDPNGQKANGFGFGVNVMNAQAEVLLAPSDADEYPSR